MQISDRLAREVEELLGELATPFFLLDLSAIDAAVCRVRSAFTFAGRASAIYYMLKCNPHPDVIKRLARNDVGFAVSHPAEIALVETHARESRLMLAGPSVDASLLRRARGRNLRFVSLNTRRSAEAWRSAETDATGLLRVSAGRAGAKFGAGHGAGCDGIAGAHVHAGTGLEPEEWSRRVLAAHAGADLPVLDWGGGFLGAGSLAVRGESLMDYARCLAALQPLPESIVEPGRHLVEDAMICVSRVLDVDGDRVFLDVGSNVLPPLASARYMSLGLLGDEGHSSSKSYRLFDAGCMDLEYLPMLTCSGVVPGDHLLIGQCGAYSYALWSTFGGERAPVVTTEIRQPAFA